MADVDVIDIGPRQRDFYQRLRDRIRTWEQGKGKNYRRLEYILTAPDIFHLMAKLLRDSRVPAEEKMKLSAAIGYFIWQIDFLPEMILGPAAYIDDVALAAYALNGLLGKVSPDVLEENWAGHGSALEVVRKIMNISSEAIGSGMWSRLKSALRRGRD